MPPAVLVLVDADPGGPVTGIAAVVRQHERHGADGDRVPVVVPAVLDVRSGVGVDLPERDPPGRAGCRRCGGDRVAWYAVVGPVPGLCRYHQGVRDVRGARLAAPDTVQQRTGLLAGVSRLGERRRDRLWQCGG